MIETIPNDANVHVVTYEPMFSAQCSVGNAPFYGVVEIIYAPDKVLLEFMSFERWLLSEVAPMKTTVEELCRFIYNALDEVLSNDGNLAVPLSVAIYAQTTTHAPASVSISNAEVKGLPMRD